MEPQPKREFTNESYMNPSLDNPKYLGRDPVVGKQEALRRLKYLPKISDKSTQLLIDLGVPAVNLIPKGSTVVERWVKVNKQGKTDMRHRWSPPVCQAFNR